MTTKAGKKYRIHLSPGSNQLIKTTYNQRFENKIQPKIDKELL